MAQRRLSALGSAYVTSSYIFAAGICMIGIILHIAGVWPNPLPFDIPSVLFFFTFAPISIPLFGLSLWWRPLHLAIGWELFVIVGEVALCIFAYRTILRGRRLLERERSGLFCKVCGYDLRATPERCPECGTISN